MTTVSNYIFRMPADTPRMDFGTLQGLLRPAQSWTYRSPIAQIGTTVEIAGEDLRGDRPAIAVRLYGTLIARIGRDSVWFPETGDAHYATTAWLSKIVYDNGLGVLVWRVRRHKSDGQGAPVPRGYAGLLVIDGDRNRPVEGHGYPVRQEVRP